MKRGEVDLSTESLSVLVEGCPQCGALVRLTFAPTGKGNQVVEIDNRDLHRHWHWHMEEGDI